MDARILFFIDRVVAGAVLNGRSTASTMAATTKQLLLTQSPLSSAPDAEANRSQQDTQIGCQTFQDHRTREGFKSAIFAPAFAVVKKCQAQTAAQ